MNSNEYALSLEKFRDTIDAIKHEAHAAHQRVNQTYDGTLPYSVHLDMVADNARLYGAEVCERADDVPAIMFGAYFHDSMEDARFTYNNVLAVARRMLDERQAVMAAEIVYALTNEKGRTRAERANDKYYAGIRSTPYAPMIKLADRLANYAYSHRKSTEGNAAMLDVYTAEMPHFMQSISDPAATDPRLTLPPAMVTAIEELMPR